MKYNPGDFSFAYRYQNVFEYDYRVIKSMGNIAWNKLKNYDGNYDYIMDIINSQLYPGHSALSYRLSLDNLVYIACFGWDTFVNDFEQS